MSAQELSPRDKTQQSVYTRWINHHCEKAREPANCKDMSTDLTSGEIMVLLSEVLVAGPATKYAKNPKNQLQRTQNQSHALTRFEDDGAQLINIHPSTLGDDSKDNTRVWLGYIFQLILRYSVGDWSAEMDSADAKKAKSLAQLKADLIAWVNSKLATLTPQERSQSRSFNKLDASEDELVVTNLEKDWQDGSALTGLCIALHPEDKRAKGFQKLQEQAAASSSDVAQLSAVISRSDTNLTVPQLMQAEELASHPDQNSIITYVSAFKKAVYVDDVEEPEVEKGQIDWDEPTFLQLEVDALEKNDLSSLDEQKQIMQSKLDEYTSNKENGVVYEPSCDRKAVRIALHLRRVATSLANAEAASASNADKDAALEDEKNKNKKAQEDAEAAAKKAQEDADAAAKKAQEDADAAAKKAQEDAEALDEERKKNKKTQADLDAANAALAKLQKRQSKLEELQRALLTCAEISDQMMSDENAE